MGQHLGQPRLGVHVASVALVDLPVMPPVLPMLAKPVKGVPDPAKHHGLSFEPKWDGFRCLVFRDGDEVDLRSRNQRPLARYFPEVVDGESHQGVAEHPPRAVEDRHVVLDDQHGAPCGFC